MDIYFTDYKIAKLSKFAYLDPNIFPDSTRVQSLAKPHPKNTLPKCTGLSVYIQLVSGSQTRTFAVNPIWDFIPASSPTFVLDPRSRVTAIIRMLRFLYFLIRAIKGSDSVADTRANGVNIDINLKCITAEDCRVG